MTVTCTSTSMIKAYAQRHLSIERVGIKDGTFLLATFGKGAIGHARSESRSTFVSKLMHEHLATEARQKIWAGRGSWVKKPSVCWSLAFWGSLQQQKKGLI